MKSGSFFDKALGALLIALIVFGLFLATVLGTVIVREMFMRDQPTEQFIEMECDSDCKELGDDQHTIECQCHPVK